MLQVQYSGGVVARYICRSFDPSGERRHCNAFGIRRPDEAVASELLLAVQPLAVEAATMAQAKMQGELDEKLRAVELEVQQAQYEVDLAVRRYESVDPANRLVATALESRWNAALARLHESQARLERQKTARRPAQASHDTLLSLAADLEIAWRAPTSDTRTRQQLIRALVDEIVVDVDAATNEIQLVIHWRGGQHSEVCVQKPRAGEHGNKTPAEAATLIREMATGWTDADIASTLNRMGIRTGTGDTWTSLRVASFRVKNGIAKYESINKDGRCLTMNEAAQKLGVSVHTVRRLITAGVLPARQVIADAPWQIQADELERPEVQEALCTRRGRGRPRRISSDDRTLKIPNT